MKGPEFKGCKTLWELFSQTVKERNDRRFLGTRNKDKEGRPYEWKSFREIYDLTSNLARGKPQIH